MASRVLLLRYASRCAGCSAELARGTKAYWDGEAKIVSCLSCHGDVVVEPPVDRGRAGGSAAREWRRRHEKREAALRTRYGRLSGLVLAVTDDPQSTAAWAYGANGERALGALLDPLRDEGMAVLHDRRLPGSRANVDHIVIARAGVFVIDAKNYRGRVEHRDRGGWFAVDDRLYVGNRDQTRLVRGMAKQADAVRTALHPDGAELPLTQAICFVDADWSLFARPLKFGAVHVLWPRALEKMLRSDGPLSSDQIAHAERRLAQALRAA